MWSVGYHASRTYQAVNNRHDAEAPLMRSMSTDARDKAFSRRFIQLGTSSQRVSTTISIPRGLLDSKSSISWVYLIVIIHAVSPSNQNGSPPGSFAFEGKARLSLTPFSTSSLSCCCLRSASSCCWAALRSASLVPHSKLPAPPLPVFAVGICPAPAAGAAAGFTLSEEGAGVPSPTVWMG